jgi:hypothetical protein
LGERPLGFVARADIRFDEEGLGRAAALVGGPRRRRGGIAQVSQRPVVDVRNSTSPPSSPTPTTPLVRSPPHTNANCDDAWKASAERLGVTRSNELGEQLALLINGACVSS